MVNYIQGQCPNFGVHTSLIIIILLIITSLYGIELWKSKPQKEIDNLQQDLFNIYNILQFNSQKLNQQYAEQSNTLLHSKLELIYGDELSYRPEPNRKEVPECPEAKNSLSDAELYEKRIDCIELANNTNIKKIGKKLAEINSKSDQRESREGWGLIASITLSTFLGVLIEKVLGRLLELNHHSQNTNVKND